MNLLLIEKHQDLRTEIPFLQPRKQWKNLCDPEFHMQKHMHLVEKLWLQTGRFWGLLARGENPRYHCLVIAFSSADPLTCFCWTHGQCGPRRRDGWSLMSLPPVTCGWWTLSTTWGSSWAWWPWTVGHGPVNMSHLVSLLDAVWKWC